MTLRTILLALLTITALPAIAQEPFPFSSLYGPGSKLYVLTESGLSLREKPGTSSTVLAVVKLGETVEVLPDANPRVPFLNSGIHGSWVKVKYQEKIGYQFDGFLSRYPPMKKADSYGNDSEKGKALSAYLKAQFTVKTENTTKPENYSLFDEIEFTNGSHYKETSLGSYELEISFPEKIMSHQEAYLMARSVWSYLNGSCKYEAAILCEEWAPQYLRIQTEDHRVKILWYVSD